MTPAALSVLLVHAKKHERSEVAAESSRIAGVVD
jgi:hypothetical protein